MDSFEQAAAAAALEKFASDLLTWATQPQGDGLPDGWRAVYQDRLIEVAAPVRRAFAEDRQALAKLREVESEARDFIGILAANPAIARKPRSEWDVAAFRTTFDRLAAGRRWFADRVRVLDAEDDTQRGRQQSREDAAGIDRNPFERARRVLSEFAWIEGEEPPFDPAGVAFDPAAVQAWGFCVDAVAALPECSGGMMGISRRLQLRFDSTHSRPVGGGTAGAIWRWENAPSGPWVSRHELQALKIAGAEWDRQQSRAASAVAAVETETQPAGRAIAEAPQPSAEKPADTQPGSTPSASPDGAAAAQGTPGADGDSGDQTEVDAKALAVHCGCTPKKIRGVLKDCPARRGERGRLWWRYGDVLETLREWSAEHRVKGLRVLWPEQAAGLRKRRR